MPNDRDLVIEQLAASERALAEEAARLREVTSVAIAALHDRDVEIERLRAQLSGLREELRRYVESKVTSRRAA